MLKSFDAIRDGGRIPYLDNMKFVLISLVVLGHTLALISDRSHLASALLNFIYLFHMPVFVFVSGLFAGSSYKEGKGGLNANRVIGFIVLYLLIYSAFWLIGIASNRGWAYNPSYTNSLAWYMLSMAWWTISIPFVSKFGILRTSIIGVTLSLIIGFNTQFGGFLVLSRTIVFAPFFYLGYFIQPRRFVVFSKRLRNSRGFIIAAAFTLFALFYLTYVNNDAASDFHKLVVGYNSYDKIGGVFASPTLAFLGRILFYIIALISGICFSSLVPQKSTAITLLGQRTLSIYSLHLIILNFITWMLPFDTMLSQLDSHSALILIFVLSFVLVIGLSLKPIHEAFSAILNHKFIPQ